ncbi:MAG: hypothetical protein HY735_00555 [Verrucomicrobia bacterium]|nr:hypothetical protein [Verrucomicrobiota bacterium]
MLGVQKPRSRSHLIAAVGTSLALVGLLAIGFLRWSASPPLTLRLISTELSDDRVHSVAKFSLSNHSSRIWTYTQGSVPHELWRLKVNVKGEWKDGHWGGYAGSSWSSQVEIPPRETRMLTLFLPADGAERRAGAFLRKKGLRADSKAIRWLRHWHYRLFHREWVRRGEFCAWGSDGISNRALLDQGLLVTNDVPSTTFDPNRWRTAKAAEKIAMGRDLAATSSLIGKQLSEVRELLGEQDATGGPEAAYWFLGFQKLSALGFPESQLLRVLMDREGRVQGVREAVSFHLALPRKPPRSGELP